MVGTEGVPLGFPKGQSHRVPGLWALERGLNLLWEVSSGDFSQAGGRQGLPLSWPSQGEDALLGGPNDSLPLLSPQGGPTASLY